MLNRLVSPLRLGAPASAFTQAAGSRLMGAPRRCAPASMALRDI